MAGKRPLARIVTEIAHECGLEIELLSQDWIINIRDPKNSSAVFIFGYNFSLNPASSALICQDKSATYLCLSRAGISCVPHEAFCNPADPLVSAYIPQSGSISGILDFCADKYSNRVVLKPLKGTGGIGVVRAFNPRDIEAAVLGLFQKDYGLVVSPYKTILREIRAVVLFGEVKLLFSKRRYGVVGDGRQPLLDLVLAHLAEFPEHSSLVDFKGLNPTRVPLPSEFVPFEWRHNLGHGAGIEVIEDREADALARKTAAALRMQFCSVDMIEARGETGLSVLEVNAGVMMDAYASDSAENRELAKSIYREAILGAFSRPV